MQSPGSVPSGVPTVPEAAPQQIRRRQLTRGAVWALPVVTLSAAAPLAAASSCQESHTFSWSQFTVPPPGNYVYPSTVSSSSGGNQMHISTTGAPGTPGSNLRVNNGADAGFPEGTEYLEISLPSTNGNQLFSQTITFTFDSPVTGLTFTIGDIDSSGSQNNPDYAEGVSLSAGFTYVKPNPTALVGSGTAADPFRISPAGTSVPASSMNGNVIVTYPGTISGFTITLFDLVDPSAGHSIDLYDLTYTGC